MRRLRIYITLLLIPAAAAQLCAGRHEGHSTLIRKAIREYREMGSSPVGWKVLGYTHEINEIYFREFGTGDRTVLIIGGLHGDEPAATISVIKFGEYLYANPELLTGRVVLIPCINPDGLMRGERTNSRRVDLNRNFPSPTWRAEYRKYYNNPGRLPATEPETVRMVNAIYDYRPWLVIQVHQPFGRIYPTNNVPVELYENMSGLSGYNIDFDIGYDTPGSLGSYASSEGINICSITFEIGPVYYEPDYGRINLSFLEAANYK